MSDLLSIVLSSIHADMARADRAAMNLANSQTPGYKREVHHAAPFGARIEAAGAGRAERAAIPGGQGQTDQRPGTLKATGEALDLAIVGDGWFEVSTAQGLAYTRQGNFRLDRDGRLVTQQGDPVMGTSGVIQLLHGSPRIDAAGRVYEGSRAESGIASMSPTAIGQVKVVQFESTNAMQRLGNGLMAHGGTAVVAAAEASVQIQQGFLENSNVVPMREMVELMQAVRHLETMQKVAIGYDELLGTSIRKLGENG
ncbi:MAG: flagellar hook basal-body protein [Comamonadaceae bacterium]|nr:MAG: flagellar hook basal-body protein [Comamonadaceae bacterium]